jgi:hypothetical protein
VDDAILVGHRFEPGTTSPLVSEHQEKAKFYNDMLNYIELQSFEIYIVGTWQWFYQSTSAI